MHYLEFEWYKSILLLFFFLFFLLGEEGSQDFALPPAIQIITVTVQRTTRLMLWFTRGLKRNTQPPQVTVFSLRSPTCVHINILSVMNIITIACVRVQEESLLARKFRGTRRVSGPGVSVSAQASFPCAPPRRSVVDTRYRSYTLRIIYTHIIQ